MKDKLQRVTVPTIVEVDEDGPRQLSHSMNVKADRECLLVIFPRPTVRQARIQFWMSFKMLASAMARAFATYIGRINIAHNAVCRFYADPPACEKDLEIASQQNEQENRSRTHGHA